MKIKITSRFEINAKVAERSAEVEIPDDPDGQITIADIDQALARAVNEIRNAEFVEGAPV